VAQACIQNLTRIGIAESDNQKAPPDATFRLSAGQAKQRSGVAALEFKRYQHGYAALSNRDKKRRARSRFKRIESPEIMARREAADRIKRVMAQSRGPCSGNPAVLLSYYISRDERYSDFVALHRAKCLRKWNFQRYRAEQSYIAWFVQKVVALKEPVQTDPSIRTVLLVGNGMMAGRQKGFGGARFKGTRMLSVRLLRELSRKLTVILADEFRTSRCCYICSRDNESISMIKNGVRQANRAVQRRRGSRLCGKLASRDSKSNRAIVGLFLAKRPAPSSDSSARPDAATHEITSMVDTIGCFSRAVRLQCRQFRRNYNDGADTFTHSCVDKTRAKTPHAPAATAHTHTCQQREGFSPLYTATQRYLQQNRTGQVNGPGASVVSEPLAPRALPTSAEAAPSTEAPVAAATNEFNRRGGWQS
jgi:hypothetical protein